MTKFLDYEGLQELLKYLALEAGENVTIERNSDKANVISAHMTAEELGALTSVTASGTSPLTLNATTTGTDVEITGSVDLSSKQDVLTAGTGIDITDNVISCTLDTTVFKIVDSLPTSDIDTNVIYVVPADNTGENNIYVEYIYVNGAWEKLGEFKADTDLSDYYTKSEVDELIAAAQLAIDNEEVEIQEIFSTMLTKSEAASTYQEILSAGDGILLSDNTISTNVTATATGDDNLTLTATSTGSAITITGSVDLSDYVTSNDLTSTLGDYLTTSTAENTYQQILTAGDGISISGNTISNSLTASASGDDYLSLSASISDGALSITGGVDLDAITIEEIDALFE